MLTKIMLKAPAQIQHLHVQSKILATHADQTDPVRPLLVFVPEVTGSGRLPVLYCLAPWTSAGRTQFDWQPFRESLFDRLLRLISERRIPPCVVVAPDLYTNYGGSQYINSDFFGRHGDFLVNELIPFVEAEFPVLPGAKHRGVFGRSSGGFGALRLALDYPGTFNAVACHSGDLGFDLLYGKDLIALANGLKKFAGDIPAFLNQCWSAPKVGGSDMHLMMLLGMAGFYSPRPSEELGYELPIDLYSGEIREAVWRKWLAHDPVLMVDKHHKSLTSLGCLYIDCGNRDQYNLQYGARQLHKKLKGCGVPHHYFEFDDNHSGTSYRYDESLPLVLGPLLSH